jgi:RimJ/RimL family protein N-acetyltransferase
MKNELSLKKVKKIDAQFLYELLSERDPKTFISHKKMPTWEEHVKFVKSKPYAKWYIIESGTKKIGTILLTFQNEVGIFIKKGTQHKGLGTRALKMLIAENTNLRYLANISPKNKESERFFKKNGFKLIQYTYEITNSK